MTNKIINNSIDSDIFQGDNSLICASAVIQNDVIIGSNTIIGPQCVIESGTKIGDNVTLQPFCVIARDTIIQDNVFIGPHFSCANDKYIQDGEHGNSPNKKPFEAHNIIIKKGARIGTRCSVAPGVIIGENCFIKMCCFIKKDVPDGMVILSNSVYPDDYEL